MLAGKMRLGGSRYATPVLIFKSVGISMAIDQSDCSGSLAILLQESSKVLDFLIQQNVYMTEVRELSGREQSDRL